MHTETELNVTPRDQVQLTAKVPFLIEAKFKEQGALYEKADRRDEAEQSSNVYPCVRNRVFLAFSGKLDQLWQCLSSRDKTFCALKD